MRELGLDGLSEDGRFLIARDPSTDETFQIPADGLASLIDASPHPAEESPSGQLETSMESSLSPREIQARIRKGESPEEVASSAGVPVEQITGFATPVLAEREYMCEQARKTPIRRKHVGGAGVALGVLVDENVAARGTAPDDVHWDSWRREDGRWTVVIAPTDADEPATFLFDAKSRFVLPTDDLAHDLVGDVAHPDSGDMAIADALREQNEAAEPTSRAKEPIEEPVEAVAEVVEEAEVETEAEEIEEPVAEVAPEEAAEREHHAAVSSIKEARERKVMEQQLALEAEAEAEEQAHEPTPQDLELPMDLEHDVAVPDTLPRKKKHARRRVPSWDEIMFGGRED